MICTLKYHEEPKHIQLLMVPGTEIRYADVDISPRTMGSNLGHCQHKSVLPLPQQNVCVMEIIDGKNLEDSLEDSCFAIK